jgi:hypothetical protein
VEAEGDPHPRGQPGEHSGHYQPAPGEIERGEKAANVHRGYSHDNGPVETAYGQPVAFRAFAHVEMIIHLGMSRHLLCHG